MIKEDIYNYNNNKLGEVYYERKESDKYMRKY